jgi:hypothetical protein
MVAFQDAASQARFVERCADRVGEFIGVQDGAPAGGAPDELPTESTQLGKIDISAWLRIAKREAWGRPGI